MAAIEGVAEDDVRVALAGGAGAPIPEPGDLSVQGLVSGLAAIISGVGKGQEVKFNVDGIIIPMPGAVGAFWSRALQSRWAAIQPGRPIVYHQDMGFFVAQDTAVQAAGQLSLEFYPKPRHESMGSFYKRVRDWTAQSTDGGAGAVVAGLAGLTSQNGTDVTLGTFTQTGAGSTQIFLIGTNMPVGGAVKKGTAIIITPPGNTDAVFVAETSALAVASNNALSASGEDEWNIPVGGKLFFKANSGTQTISARFRS